MFLFDEENRCIFEKDLLTFKYLNLYLRTTRFVMIRKDAVFTFMSLVLVTIFVFIFRISDGSVK